MAKMLAKIMVKNHHNGSLNPKAHFQNELTIEQVVNAPITPGRWDFTIAAASLMGRR
jgi:acetyl-CoA acetyltransferase